MKSNTRVINSLGIWLLFVTLFAFLSVAHAEGVTLSGGSLAQYKQFFTVDKSTRKIYKYDSTKGYTDTTNVLRLFKDISNEFTQIESIKSSRHDAEDNRLYISGFIKVASGVYYDKVLILDATSGEKKKEFHLPLEGAIQRANWRDIAVDAKGIVYVADVRSHKILRLGDENTTGINVGGFATVVAGGQDYPAGSVGYSGDNDKAIDARLNSPQSIAFDRYGNLFVADTGNNRIRYVKADASGLLNAASSTIHTLSVVGSSYQPLSLSFDARNYLYFFDDLKKHWMVVKADSGWSTVAGNASYSDVSQAEFAGYKNSSNYLKGDPLNNTTGDFKGDWVFQPHANATSASAFSVNNVPNIGSNIYWSDGTKALKEVSFTQSGVGGSSNAYYGPSGAIDIAKNGARFEFDFFPSSSGRSEQQVLFSIYQPGSTKSFAESLLVTLTGNSLQLYGYGKDITRQNIKRYYDQNGNLYNSALDGAEQSTKNHSTTYGSLDLGSRLKRDDWNKLNISFTEDGTYRYANISLGGSSVGKIRIGKTTMDRDDHETDYDHYQKTTACYATVWERDNGASTYGFTYDKDKMWYAFECIKGGGYQEAKGTPRISKHPAEAFPGHAFEDLRAEVDDNGNEYAEYSGYDYLVYPKNYYRPDNNKINTPAKFSWSTLYKRGVIPPNNYNNLKRFPAKDSFNKDRAYIYPNFDGLLQIGAKAGDVTYGAKGFTGLISNFKVNGVLYNAGSKGNEYPDNLIGLAGAQDTATAKLIVQGKNSSPSLHNIVGSDVSPRVYEITGGSYTLNLPLYIAIAKSGKVYYDEDEAKQAERDNAANEIIETHVLEKFYPALNNQTPIDKATLTSQAKDGYYQATANISSGQVHRAFVEYTTQYKVELTAIRPVKTGGELAFSDSFAGLPFATDSCPNNDVDNTNAFNSTSESSVVDKLGGAIELEKLMGSVDFSKGMSFCRKNAWVSAKQTFDPSVNGVVYNPADNAGKRYRLVRVYAEDGLSHLSKDFSLSDGYADLEAGTGRLSKGGKIAYIWTEQYLVKVNTSKSKTSQLARVRINGKLMDHADYIGDGNLWIDKGSKVELLVPVTNAEFSLDGFSIKEEGQDETVISFENTDASSSSVFEQVEIDGTDYYAVEINHNGQGINNMVNINWSFGDRIYQYELTLGQEFIPGVTKTTDGFDTDDILARKFAAIQGASHDPATMLPQALKSYVHAGTKEKVTSPPQPPEGTSKVNAYVWQNRSAQEGFKGAMYFTRPGVYQLEWLLGGDDYPIEGTQGFQKLVATVIVKWPEMVDFTHIGGTPDVALDPSESDGLKFKELRYTESKALEVENGVLKYPEWNDVDNPNPNGQPSDGKVTAPRSVLLFTQAKEAGQAATGDVNNEKIIIVVAETKKWDKQLKDNVAAIIGSEITSDYHGDDIGHNGYLIPFPDKSNPLVDKTPLNAATYDRSSMKGELFAVNQEQGDSDKVYKDGKHDIAVVWYKRLESQNITPLTGEGYEAIWPAWPYQTVRYEPIWPELDSDSLDRIVIASRMGSDGLNNNTSKEPQLKFDPAKYSNLTLYNQPDKNKPGYNPNEEHALVAKSWRYRTET